MDLSSGTQQGAISYLSEVARAVSNLQEQVATLSGRVVGVELSQRALSEGAASAAQARSEFQALAQSLSTMREQAHAEILAPTGVRSYTPRGNPSSLGCAIRSGEKRAEDLATGVNGRLEALEDGLAQAQDLKGRAGKPAGRSAHADATAPGGGRRAPASGSSAGTDRGGTS
eukprot:6815736-Alexandrium_andersonii.AAC.1